MKSILFFFILWLDFAFAENHQWVKTKSINEWLNPFDLCLLSNSRNISIHEITGECEKKIPSDSTPLPPVRCRIGNTWPSRSSYCDPIDLPLAQRQHLQQAIYGYDRPESKPLELFFKKLAKDRGILISVGDSVMQQYFSAMACELEREHVWKDSSQFTNTDETRYISFTDLDSQSPSKENSFQAAMKFYPLYHLVNSKYDRIPNAPLHNFKRFITEIFQNYQTIVLLVNMGLHYIDNPEKGFSKQDYFDQMKITLLYLSNLYDLFPSHKIRIYWRETSAQHFPTPNGYWPGVRYAKNLHFQCVPVEDQSPQADWRNRFIEQIIRENHLVNISIIPFYNMTLDMWSEHPNGHLRDCTHFCWSPMFHQPTFHYLNNHYN